MTSAVTNAMTGAATMTSEIGTARGSADDATARAKPERIAATEADRPRADRLRRDEAVFWGERGAGSVAPLF